MFRGIVKWFKNDCKHKWVIYISIKRFGRYKKECTHCGKVKWITDRDIHNTNNRFKGGKL